MKMYKNIKKTEKDTCVALGFFDGLHIGHMKVISQMINFSTKNNFVPTIFTFNDSPKVSTLKNKNVEYLFSQEEKKMLFCKNGVEILYSVPFSLIKDISPENFVKNILCEKLKAKHIFCGFNYHFGKGGGSGVSDLKKICKLFEITVHEIKPVIYNNEPISSTRIRKFLKAGNIKLANKMLGRNYSYKYLVIHGKGIGRQISIPTINQNFPENFVVPHCGVYASFTTINNKKYRSITNIGVRPTISENSKPHSETFVFEYIGKELYNQNIKIELCEFLREEKKFKNIEELKQNILKDKERAKLVLTIT